MTQPNFFILGAPKCGTTSLAIWLSQHPQVFVSDPKEPNFFNTDYRVPSRPASRDAYERLFDGATREHLAVGEASTCYLRSRVAVPAILRYNPSARFIVCLRNPIEMAPSCHAQLVKTGTETVLSFERAWDLQEERRNGKGIPVSCSDAKTLLYGETCRLGEQMERLLGLVPRENIHIVLLERMNGDPGQVYREVTDFLGLETHLLDSFSVANVRSRPRSPKLAQIVARLSRLKHLLGMKQGTGIGRLIGRINIRPAGAESISPQLQKRLRDYFTADILKLEKQLGLGLDRWLG